MSARLAILTEFDLPTSSQLYLDQSFPEKKGVSYSRVISGTELCQLVPSMIPVMVRNGYRELSFLLTVDGEREESAESVEVGKSYDAFTEKKGLKRQSWSELDQDTKDFHIKNKRNREASLETLIDKI